MVRDRQVLTKALIIIMFTSPSIAELMSVSRIDKVFILNELHFDWWPYGTPVKVSLSMKPKMIKLEGQDSTMDQGNVCGWFAINKRHGPKHQIVNCQDNTIGIYLLIEPNPQKDAKTNAIIDSYLSINEVLACGSVIDVIDNN